jgi:hypothetical protein
VPFTCNKSISPVENSCADILYGRISKKKHTLRWQTLRMFIFSFSHDFFVLSREVLATRVAARSPPEK